MVSPFHIAKFWCVIYFSEKWQMFRFWVVYLLNFFVNLRCFCCFQSFLECWVHHMVGFLSSESRIDLMEMPVPKQWKQWVHWCWLHVIPEFFQVVATQIFFIIHPDPWGFMIHFDEYFSDGWFNHQLVFGLFCFFNGSFKVAGDLPCQMDLLRSSNTLMLEM